MQIWLLLITVHLAFFKINCFADWSEDRKPEKWNKYALDKLNYFLNRKLNQNIAKNVIFFLGDGTLQKYCASDSNWIFFYKILNPTFLLNKKGMGISTVTAGRIRKGQVEDRNGEEEITNMESLDHLALSKVDNHF
jgi:alkaline phosphatase